jgi:hypothetical protein
MNFSAPVLDPKRPSEGRDGPTEVGHAISEDVKGAVAGSPRDAGIAGETHQATAPARALRLQSESDLRRLSRLRSRRPGSGKKFDARQPARERVRHLDASSWRGRRLQ